MKKTFLPHSMAIFIKASRSGNRRTIPKTHYISITAQIGDKTIQVPAEEIENLFQVSNQSAACYYDRENDTLYISINNSEVPVRM
ncbi:hypothetical protein EJ377_03510 [Chryseobacterium arthrosphaerae]|uniref:Uncharacterized protein n=1 Tax=Chryseobacterium arthrosphaerae TaxID=651561 RepID=A0A432DZ46_9FLAO|nr:hypothetical protein EJ377_03510 [Chryseobacterium arthrosphaerae]